MSMSMKSRMNLSGNWWNWLAGMAVPCRRSGNCSVNIRPMWNVRRSKMGNSTGCSGLRRMRKIPIIIVLRMRESISFTIVFAGGLQGVWSLMKTDTDKAADQQGEIMAQTILLFRINRDKYAVVQNVCRTLGIRIIDVARKDYSQKLGTLAQIQGFTREAKI